MVCREMKTLKEPGHAREDPATHGGFAACRIKWIPNRGKGSHSFWKHHTYSEIPVITLSGRLGNDAKAYQERIVRNALAQVKGREQDNEYER